MSKYALCFPAMLMIVVTAFLASQVTADEDPIKCTPCLQTPPPPSPPPPSPPPPPSCPPPPALPPPPPKKSGPNCPPPPPTFIYMTGPPGNIYPVDQEFSGAGGKSWTSMKLSALLTFGIIVLF